LAQADGWLRNLLGPDPVGKVLRETMTVTSLVQRLQALALRAVSEDGQAMVEYALLISLVALVAFGTVNAFGHGVSKLYSHIVSVYP
jgi:Flp pilus assembly pilin Flp